MKKYLITAISILSFIVNGLGQEITNINTSISNGTITITYDLKSKDTEHLYNIEVYSSVDKYKKPLKFVSGSVGSKIAVGLNKSIVWQASEELIDYVGDIDFEIRGQVLMPLSFTNTFDKKYKIGNKIEVDNKGYISNDDAYFIIQNKTDSLVLYPSPGESNNTVLKIPKNVKKGSYNLKLVNPYDKQVASSPVFQIKSKKLGLKIAIPILVLGGGVFGYLMSQSSTSSPTSVDDNLATAPLPNN